MGENNKSQLPYIKILLNYDKNGMSINNTNILRVNFILLYL